MTDYELAAEIALKINRILRKNAVSPEQVLRLCNSETLKFYYRRIFTKCIEK